jgi:cell surface protein SprA
MFRQNYEQKLSFTAQLEPIKELLIDINLDKSFSKEYTELFKDTLNLNKSNDKQHLNPYAGGGFSVSFISFNTLFGTTNPNIVSETFKEFESFRPIISRRLAAANPYWASGGGVIGANGYASGYGQHSQDVLIPAFIAAYTGQDVNKIGLTAFPRIPLPNWRLDYAGLTKLPFLAEKFSSINLSHGYTATYSVDQFTSSLRYGGDTVQLGRSKDITPTAISETGVLVPVFNINQVSIIERFSPLIGINIRTKSKVTLKFDYNRDRTVVMNTSNASITEQKTQDYTFGLGYQKSGIKLPFKVQGQQVVLKNEVTMRCDVSFRNTLNIQRSFVQANKPQQGSIRELQIRPTINYVVNQRLNLQAYFSYVNTFPFTSGSFPTRTTRFGIQVRFNLN